jgi:hypothetical protein
LFAAVDATEPSPADARLIEDLLLGRPGKDPLENALAALAVQVQSGERSQPPLVIRVPGNPDLRFGFVHSRTDINAFLEALLGGRVPTRPRWLREPLILGGQVAATRPFDALRQLGTPEIVLDQLRRARRQPERVRAILCADLIWLGARLGLDDLDPALDEYLQAIVGQVDLKSHPLLSLIERMARQAPASMRPAGLKNFRPIHIIQPVSPETPFRAGIVVWWPGISRSGLAARLRFVHARVLAPWSTSLSDEDRQARYAAYLARLGSERLSMTVVARRLLTVDTDIGDQTKLVRRLNHWGTEASEWAQRPTPIG